MAAESTPCATLPGWPAMFPGKVPASVGYPAFQTCCVQLQLPVWDHIVLSADPGSISSKAGGLLEWELRCGGSCSRTTRQGEQLLFCTHTS